MISRFLESYDEWFFRKTESKRSGKETFYVKLVIVILSIFDHIGKGNISNRENKISITYLVKSYPSFS